MIKLPEQTNALRDQIRELNEKWARLLDKAGRLDTPEAALSASYLAAYSFMSYHDSSWPTTDVAAVLLSLAGAQNDAQSRDGYTPTLTGGDDLWLYAAAEVQVGILGGGFPVEGFCMFVDYIGLEEATKALDRLLEGV